MLSHPGKLMTAVRSSSPRHQLAGGNVDFARELPKQKATRISPTFHNDPAGQNSETRLAYIPNLLLGVSIWSTKYFISIRQSYNGIQTHCGWSSGWQVCSVQARSSWYILTYHFSLLSLTFSQASLLLEKSAETSSSPRAPPERARRVFP